jgi:AraC-like DNA-binding protein
MIYLIVRPSSENTKFIPLLGVLKQMQFWFESARPPQIMLAAATMEEFNSQKLPPHCEVEKRKIRGPRVPVRGQHVKQHPYAVAHWPNDVLVEGMKSMLAVVISGDPVLRVADYQVHCQPGDFLFIPGRFPKWDRVLLPHRKITTDTHHELVLFWGGAPDPSHVHMRICRYHNERDTPNGAGEACWVTNSFPCQLFCLLDAHLQNGFREKSTFHLLASLISLLQEEIEKGDCFDSLTLPSDSPFSQLLDPIEHALQYIQNHLETPLSIDIVAHWVGLSRSVFTRRFRAAMNQSFVDYLTEQRLQQAKVLLSQTDLSIVRISERVGLLPGRLRQLFGKKYQCTPMEFRRSQR